MALTKLNQHYAEAIERSFQTRISFAWNAAHPLPSSSGKRCFSPPSRGAALSAEVLAGRPEICTQQSETSVVRQPYCPLGSVVIGELTVAFASSTE